MPDATSVRDFYPEGRDLKVGEFIDILKDFPQDSSIGFQVSDEEDSPTLKPVAIVLDKPWNITDVVFVDWAYE